MIFISYNSSQTKQLGEELGLILPAGTVIALEGELGAGKTCLAQGIIKGLGVRETYITSPSYTLINEYSGRYPVFHFDFYRLISLQEVDELGCEEYFFGRGVTIIEWADKIRGLLPQNHIQLKLNKIEETIRQVDLIPWGETCKDLLRQLGHVNLVA